MTFLRRDSNRLGRLGKNRKKKQTWRRPTGRHNKMREKKRGYPAVVSIGYSVKKEDRGKMEGLTPLRVETIKDVEKLTVKNIAVLGKMGTKKKIEILKKIKEKKIKVKNLNIEKFLKENVVKEKKK